MQCPKPDCMYLHELGDEAASFTKEEMQVKCGNNSLASPSKDMDLFERQSSKAAPFSFRRENTKSTSKNSSKTYIKLTLAFCNLQHVVQRSLKVNPTRHRG